MTDKALCFQVEVVIKKHRDQLMKERYRYNMGLLMGEDTFHSEVVDLKRRFLRAVFQERTKCNDQYEIFRSTLHLSACNLCNLLISTLSEIFILPLRRQHINNSLRALQTLNHN